MFQVCIFYRLAATEEIHVRKPISFLGHVMGRHAPLAEHFTIYLIDLMSDMDTISYARYRSNLKGRPENTVRCDEERNENLH